jgi:hypothetical protein
MAHGCRPHLQGQRRAGWLALDVDLALRTPHEDRTPTHGDVRGHDGVRKKLAAGIRAEVLIVSSELVLGQLLVCRLPQRVLELSLVDLRSAGNVPRLGTPIELLLRCAAPAGALRFRPEGRWRHYASASRKICRLFPRQYR